jgi:hypothetical protein
VPLMKLLCLGSKNQTSGNIPGILVFRTRAEVNLQLFKEYPNYCYWQQISALPWV